MSVEKEKLNKFEIWVGSIIIIVIILLVLGGKKDKEDVNLVDDIQSTIDSNQGEEIKKLKDEIEQLKQYQVDIAKDAPNKTINNSNLSLVIKKWRPFVSYIECDFRYPDGSLIYTGSGSGLLFPSTDSALILTNRHVISLADKYAAYVCRIQTPDDQQSVTIYSSEQEQGGSVFQELGKNMDVGAITINQPTPYMIGLTQKLPRPLNCGTPSIGDRVVVLGYPGVGSRQDITATEGIISGFDGDYFITSAKVEQGNSGGVAILVDKDCYLGLPSYAEVGQIESLARILDFNVIARILLE